MDEEEEVRVRTTAKAGERKSGRVILNTRELTEQIHLPTLSFCASFPFLTNPPPPTHLPFVPFLFLLICFSSRLLLP